MLRHLRWLTISLFIATLSLHAQTFNNLDSRTSMARGRCTGALMLAIADHFTPNQA